MREAPRSLSALSKQKQELHRSCTQRAPLRPPLVQRGTDTANLDFALDVAVQALTYYETLLDVDYPLPKVRPAIPYVGAASRGCAPNPCERAGVL